MIRQPAIYFLLSYCLLIVQGCKSKEEESPLNLRIEYSKLVLYEGDTIVFNLYANDKLVAASQWASTIGTINNAGNYISPSFIDTHSVAATVFASYQNQSTSAYFTITKKAFSQPYISYVKTIQPLLANNCNFNGCHANGSRAGKVDLSIFDSVVKNVIPFNATSSKFYYSLIKTDPLRVMPPAGKLHDDKIETVRLWIEQGALNN